MKSMAPLMHPAIIHPDRDNSDPHSNHEVHGLQKSAGDMLGLANFLK